MPDVTASVDERVVPEFGERQFQQWVARILNRWPAVGLAVGVVRDGRLVHFTGHGLVDIGDKRPITQDTVFRIASITKTFTAVAVMQLWERGLVDLDAPANDYLRGYKLVTAAAGHRPATVRQLLTHTAGVPQMVHLARVLKSGWFGESFGLRHRPAALRAHPPAPRDRLPPGVRVCQGGDRSPVGDRRSLLDLLHPEGHGPIPGCLSQRRLP
jgi:CubicO group peptidase (beta-lactamase class C family)